MKHLYLYAGDKNAKIVIDFCHPTIVGPWSEAERGGTNRVSGAQPPKQIKAKNRHRFLPARDCGAVERSGTWGNERSEWGTAPKKQKNSRM